MCRCLHPAITCSDLCNMQQVLGGNLGSMSSHWKGPGMEAGEQTANKSTVQSSEKL